MRRRRSALAGEERDRSKECKRERACPVFHERMGRRDFGQRSGQEELQHERGRPAHGSKPESRLGDARKNALHPSRWDHASSLGPVHGPESVSEAQGSTGKDPTAVRLEAGCPHHAACSEHTHKNRRDHRTDAATCSYQRQCACGHTRRPRRNGASDACRGLSRSLHDVVDASRFRSDTRRMAARIRSDGGAPLRQPSAST